MSTVIERAMAQTHTDQDLEALLIEPLLSIVAELLPVMHATFVHRVCDVNSPLNFA